MSSKFLSLNGNDFIKGFVVSVIGGALGAAYSGLSSGSIGLKEVGTTAALTGIAYLSKNFISNSNGTILKKEQ